MFALKLNLPVKGIIKRTIFSQFCGGENITECSQTINQLAKFGIGTILDYSVEGKTKDEDFEATVNEIIATILSAAKHSSIPFAVFKVTGIAEFSILEKANKNVNDLTDSERDGYQKIVTRVDKICKVAFEHKIPVFIDAEESWIQDTIDTICLDMMRKYNRSECIVFNTLQMYRHDRLSFLKEMIVLSKEEGFHYGIKLVRGAYMEKERDRAERFGYSSPIQPDKESSDQDFNLALGHILENIGHLALCAGTHNEKSSLLLTELIHKYGLEKNDKRVYFAQLLGMSDHISYNLSDAGYNVAKYVPYGPVKEVMPYLLRRANENTSVAGQTGRELSLIMKEKKRRSA